MLRDALKQLIYEMVYLNLSFNSASVGGQSDYTTFLEALKVTHRISALKDELKVNIAELSEIVEQIEQERQRIAEAVVEQEEIITSNTMTSA